ncbi:hypothetical protein [Spiroplasma ixodetis]|uniref:hypothetical protein n=1 Tax=Spiroplasma ixodetis TaxID=2141 RepID=UPI002577BAB8|nr:hypothetical protein [Spiroplasma ixodetis]
MNSFNFIVSSTSKCGEKSVVCYLIRHIDDIRFNFLPKPSVKTIYRWLKRFGFYSQKTIKKKTFEIWSKRKWIIADWY